MNLYERLGEAALRRLSTAFYERVYADRAPLPDGTLLRQAFANTTKADAAANQSAFLIERLGGPPLYTERKGPFALIGRHAPYAGVTRDAALRWLPCPRLTTTPGAGCRPTSDTRRSSSWRAGRW